MKLWDFVVAIHAAPGVDEGLIALQDNHGQCVSYLLWAVWAARESRPVSEAALAEATALTHAWENEVTAPLRAARRNLKRPWPPMDDQARETFRERVKAEEFAAERLLLDTLETLTLTPTPTPTGDPIAVRGALAKAMAAWSPPASVETAASLLPMFETFAI